ncbi:hypothetical protein PVAP13_7KG053018 [Panicum virgatum]|uniref:DUF4220 domain-containing protein n=1 Tax=Panicum virgatum TaxID=38727 RepID=A0A8T0Q6A7_PANVG|nr:hypothetical protein PVAP13_7KG053018 [Panicum virgatum]
MHAYTVMVPIYEMFQWSMLKCSKVLIGDSGLLYLLIIISASSLWDQIASAIATMAMAPLDLWNEWATQILVLLSLSLQVVLLLLAGIRRREASPMPKFILWLAYQLADSTAIYAVGHLSLCGVPVKHQLVVAFWAPFLLLHLGGPDNITAYALEDSKLWLRHLQNLVVQVLGAAYVLYKYVPRSDSFIFLAAILMFAVGVVKYAERTWALKHSNMGSIRSSLHKERVGIYHHLHPRDYGSMVDDNEGDEFSVRRAHSMFHLCKRAIVDFWEVSVEKDPAENQSSWEENHNLVVNLDIKKEKLNYKSMWVLMEMELSLMYDLQYTKAGVIHTWSGYGIRVASSLTAAASILLFSFSSKDGQSRVDVAVSYTLLAGALLLEMMSLLRALGSSWTYAFLCKTQWTWLRDAALCSGRWDRLRWHLKAITGRGRNSRSARRPHNRAYQPLLGRIARMLGYHDLWIRYYGSGSVEFSEYLKHQLFEYIKHLTTRGGLNMQGVIRKNWGQEAFERQKQDDIVSLYKSLKERGNNYLGAEFQEGIIIWHIATDVFIAKSRGDDADGAADMVKAIRTLSNYMIFLLVDRPYMLPGLAQSMLYQKTCENLVNIRESSPDREKRGTCMKLKEFFSLRDDPDRLMHVDELANILSEKEPPLNLDMPRLYFSYRVAEKLHDKMKEKGRAFMLQLLLDVWMDFLVYAANRCSRESHAKKLSNGGELTTILWLMTYYLHLDANNASTTRRTTL